MYAIDRYIVKPLTLPGPSPARAQDAQGCVPQSTCKCSYAELVNPHGCYVHYFVSHTWAHGFRETTRALRRWAVHRSWDVGLANSEDVVFWLSLFALNQHKAADEVGSSPEAGPFNAALGRALHGGVMVIDDQVRSFGRIWCLFEFHRLNVLGKDFDLICEDGPLRSLVSDAPNGDATQAALEYMERVGHALKNVNAASASASNIDDKLRIWHAIAEPCVRDIPLDMIMKAPDCLFDAGAFLSFDRAIQWLLAAPLLAASLANGDCQAALNWCALGAPFGTAEVATLDSINNDLLTASMVQLLIGTTASFGNLEGMQVLLEGSVEMRCEDSQSWCTVIDDAFLCATLLGHHAAVEVLLAHDANIEKRNCDGFTALMVAAMNDYLGVVDVLLTGGANVEAKQLGKTALLTAARRGHREIVAVLLTGGANIEVPAETSETDIGHSALVSAACQGHCEVLETLLARGANIEAMDQDAEGGNALIVAACGGRSEVVELLLAHGANIEAKRHDGGTALLAAAASGHCEVVVAFLAHGANIEAPDSTGNTSLMRAAAAGHREVVQVLLAHKANNEAPDSDGKTPLMRAAISGDSDVVKTLLTCRAYVNSKTSKQRTALMFAALQGHRALVQALLLRAANVEDIDAEGMTVLMCAAARCHHEVVELLLEHRANVDAIDKNGLSVLMRSAMLGSHKTVEVLVAHGANVEAKLQGQVTALHLATFGGHQEVVQVLQATLASMAEHHAEANIQEAEDMRFFFDPMTEKKWEDTKAPVC